MGKQESKKAGKQEQASKQATKRRKGTKVLQGVLGAEMLRRPIPWALAASGLMAFGVQEVSVSSGLGGREQGISPPDFAQRLQHGTAWKEITAEELRGVTHVTAEERHSICMHKKGKAGR